jgi:hypothetical protein
MYTVSVSNRIIACSKRKRPVRIVDYLSGRMSLCRHFVWTRINGKRKSEVSPWGGRYTINERIFYLYHNKY